MSRPRPATTARAPRQRIRGTHTPHSRRSRRLGARADLRVRLRAGIISLVVGSALLAAKFFAYQLTGSTAILSDALESIVNVVAAMFAIGGLVFAGRPADRSHPYGHGKIEFFSAAFEGGLIAFAAVMIVYEAGISLLHGNDVRQLDWGVAITAAAGCDQPCASACFSSAPAGVTTR